MKGLTKAAIVYRDEQRERKGHYRPGSEEAALPRRSSHEAGSKNGISLWFENKSIACHEICTEWKRETHFCAQRAAYTKACILLASVG